MPNGKSPVVYWIGNADLISESEGKFLYRLRMKVPIPFKNRYEYNAFARDWDPKEACQYFQIGWPYAVKGSSELVFLESPNKEFLYDIRQVGTPEQEFSNFRYINLYFRLPFKMQTWMYISPLNQYDEGFSNEEVFATLNSFWPQTDTKYIEDE